MVINEVDKCRVCGRDVIEIIDFGNIYINDFPSEPQKHKGKAPMVLDQCLSCSLVQMRHTVDSQILYGDHYWYESGLNPKLKQNLLDIAEIANSKTEPGDCVLDIGANLGNVSCFILEKKSCQVFSFEPNALCFEILKRRFYPSIKIDFHENTIFRCRISSVLF